MSFLGRGIGTAIMPGIGTVIGNQFDQERGRGSSGPAPWNPLTAKNVAISPDLAKTMGTIGTGAASAIGANYSGAKKKLSDDAIARGMSGGAAVSPNSYGGQRLAAGQGLDTGSLEAALGGQMAGTAYENALQDREYGQNLSLADQIAELNRPNKLQQIFQGIGAVGKPVSTFAGMGGFAKRGGGGRSPAVASNPYDMMDMG